MQQISDYLLLITRPTQDDSVRSYKRVSQWNAGSEKDFRHLWMVEVKEVWKHVQ